MKLSEIGEFGFIKRLSLPFVQNLPDGIVGIGDDCAVVQWRDETSLLVTTDMLIEGIHFLRAKISPRDLGYKSLAVNLSDIAAMGGTPMSAFISIGIPNEIEVEWLDDFYGGLHELAEAESVSLLGEIASRSGHKSCSYRNRKISIGKVSFHCATRRSHLCYRLSGRLGMRTQDAFREYEFGK